MALRGRNESDQDRRNLFSEEKEDGQKRSEVHHHIKQDARLSESGYMILYEHQMTGTAHRKKFRQSLYDTKQDPFPKIQKTPSLLERDASDRRT
mgnify:CR=1 FL=1